MTKYKPLYALYKGLKEHGTDLPDSYGSFERSMTQAGNAGASNRRNFYQSLKDSNYDVPDTYEKFYESMFVPVNNTTSRARKIGETPMTEEDRKGFTLGAQDIRMNASKFAAGDALRYNKLKQRKQKQRKDFGRVKVGTNKTPYAPTDNVVNDEGLNTYVTSDSSDTTNLDYAQQKQAVLDEQNQAYMNAIERGDIPMASETIDKNGLYDLQENIGKDGTEVTEKGIKEQAEARLNVAYQKQKDIMAQLSAAMDGGFSTFEERMQLSATKNKIDEEVRNIEALAGKESSGFWNTLSDVANTIPLLHNIKEGINYLFGDDTSKDMYKAIANSMVQSNWDFGVSDIQNSVKLEQIRDKINKGEAVTKEEKEFLDANQKADKSAEWVDQYGSRAYRWTSGAGVSVPYMIDFYITGGLPLMRGMTQAFGRGAMKIAAKRGWGKLAHNIMYYTGVAAGDIIGSYAMATTVQGMKTGSDVLNRHLGTLYQDEKGNYAFGTFDENGNFLHEGGESFGKALYKGVTAAMLENYTEKMFGHWHLKSGAFDLLDKNPYTKKLADFFRGVGNKNWYLDTKKFSSKFGIGSYPEEVAEEIVNIPLNAWLVGDNSIKELGDRKTWEDIAGSMAISVGSMAGMASTPHIVRGAANQGIKAYDFAAFYVFKNRLNQANQRASEILGDEWEVIKNRIDSAPNENLGRISADLHKQVSEGKYSEEQLDAAWAYIQNLRVMRGYNLAKTMEMQAKAMTGDENTPADIRQKQLNAAYAAGQETEGENKHLSQVEYEKQKFNLASALGVSDSELENMTDEQISSNLGLDDNLDNVIYNYQNAKALYDGIMDNAQNAVDTATKVAAQRVDAMTNVEDGTIKQALVKGTMGKDDYPVYVISGNIETHDDGIINYSDSDSMIIVYNVATGRKETIPVSMLSAVNPYIQNAEDFKAQAVNEAKEKTITELSNVIDGKLVDGSQFTMEDAQGQIHEYKIEGIDEQGNCIISVDGTILPEPLSLDAIQQQYDQSNVARSVKNDQTAQEPEQIQQESQPIEDKFDYAKITNENDGKVKRVDVTDEEGKNRFPNAKAVFLIQDKGAMPKFVVTDEEGNLTSYVGKRGDKIHLKGEMTIDEYKKQRQEELQMIAAENADSSMVEDNSGTIGVEDNTQPLSETDADNVISQMESSAETAPDLELTPDNWTAEFGEDGILSTPIGDVKMGENQVAKLFEKGRSKEFGMIKPTLTNPDVIIEVPSHSADGNEERSSSYLFIKTFLGKNGEKVYYFKSVTIKKDGLEISISSHYDRAKRVKETLMKGKLLYRKNDGAQTEQNQPSTSVTTSQEDAAGSSESKDTNISSNGNENNESLTFEDGTPIPVDVNGEVDLSQTDATHAAEWYDNNLGEDADDWLDGEIKKAKKVLEQAKNKKLTGSKPSELVASKKEKEAAIADAQAHYDSAISIRDSLKERRIAKEENTSEGRKELIEKARRKFARLKSAVKDDAESVAQLYKETIGSLLHRLYDGTGIDVTDTIPLTSEEYVASNLGAHSLNYEGTETSKGVKQETGLSREDFAKTQLLAADGKGTTIDELVHSLWENRPSNLESLDTQEIRNALIGVLNSGFKASEARNFVENIRIAQAENILEEQKRAQDDAAYAEQHKAEPEAELKAKSDEKAELKAKSEAKLDNESSNESNDLSNETDNDLDNEKTNDNINDNINTPEVPEDATEENPLGAQRDSAPFSPKDNTKVTNSSEERKAMVKKNAVRSEDVLDHSIGKKMRKSLSRIAKMMGADIIYLHSADSNGWYDEKTNTIYLALDSADVLGTQFVFGHEMTHEIKAKNPAAFEELKNLVKNMMGEDAFNTITDKTQQKYEKGGATYWKDRNAMEEEVVADQIGNWIHDANYAHTLMMKMSHPLLAKLHEIVNRIRFAFIGTEYSDNAKLILRSIEQAYVKTANGQVTNSETGEDVSFSLRQKPEPKKKGIGYKVFVLKDGKLYPPMVANPDGAATPVGVWLDADAAPIAGESKTGRPQVKQGGKGTQGGSGKLAYRPGWHLGVVPYAIQFNRKDADGNKTLFPKNFVFAEVEYAADVDYQEEARQEGINPSGKYQHSLAGLKHLPTDGYYMYRTNPNPETDPWVITGAMKVNRILTRAEQAELVKNAGREPQQIQEGDIVTDDVVNSINQEIADAPKFSLKDIKPVGVGAFGNIYNQFRGNAKAAIDFLKKVRGGEAVGALHHKDIGDIDLVWGKEGTGHSDGYGLSKLVKYHPEVLDNLQEILNDMRVVSSSKNRVNLESETHKAGVRLTWDGERKSWLLTAFKKETSASDKRTDTAATSLEGDTALSQTEGSAAKIDNSSETAKGNDEKFSLKDEKTLAGVHNISEEKLLKAIKQGGLANPSVAVIDSSRQDHKAYGGISLILPSDKIAKRTGKNAGTWQGDAYTPTYPEVEKQMSNKGAEKSSSDVLSVPKEMQHEVRNGIDRWLNGGDANSGLKYLFLHEKGVAPEPKKIQPKFSDEAYNELKLITAGYFNIYGIGKADAQKVLDMYIEAKFDGDKDLYEEKTKAWLERNKSIVDAGAKGGMRYAIAKENVELYDEYGFNYKGVQTFVRDVEYDHRKSGVDTNATLNEVEDYIKTNNLTDEFNTWLEGKEKEYGIKEVIFDGFTPSGNRRYVPNTLENVSKLMKKQGRNGATGAAVSFQNFAARLMPSYGTLKDIRSKKGLLTSDREKFDKFREKWSNVFFELGMKCQPDATGTFDDYGLARLSEAAMTSDPQAYLKKEYNVDFSDEDTKRLKEMVKAIKEEHPAMYFETKFERPVRFDEFSAAVVPTTTKKEVKEALKNAGVSIFEYDEKSDADRKRAFNEAINSSDNIRFSLAGERGAADMAEDLKSLNTPDEVDDAIKTAIDDMPSGWKMANKKMIHIAQALGENRKAEIAGEEPKFSLKDGTLIKAGTYFSGGGLVEEGLKGIIDPVVAVEYDEKISGVYRNNFGQHIVTADVRDVDPKELVKQIDGEVEYFHASPVCKNYSQAKSNHAEVELDKETAASTAEFINAIKPKVVTIENVKGYKDSEAMKTITDALDANGYTWDADVYNAADYGGYTNRERLIVRAVRNGKLPEKPKKMEHKRGWYEAVADIIPTLTEKKNGVAPWMDIRLKADGIDWRNIDKPLYVMGSAYADGKIPHAFADELLPTLRTKSGDVIVMPDGKVYRAMGRVLARVSGVSDDYKMPFSENLSHTIIGNGIPTQLTEHVIAPLLTGSDPKFSIRTYHGTGASFDKFDFSHMGEGEGSQAFGWGGYVTNSKDIAEDYTRRAKIRKDNGGFEFVTDMSANNKDMVRQYIYKHKDVNKGLDAMRKDLSSALEMFPDDDDLKELSNILAKKNEEIAVPDNIAYLYDVDIPDDNGDYLDWDAPLTDKQKNTIIKELRRLKIDFADFKKRGFSFDGSFGGNAYDFLMYALRKTKKWKDVNASRAVSKFLSSIGFTGIKYKAGTIFGGAKEDDYNYVIFDENNANIVGNTRFSLRGSTPYDKQMEEWMEKNNLEKGAVPMEKPIMKEGENIFDYANRMVEWTRNQNLWKTAPKQTGFQDALDKWKADNGLSPDAYPPVRPHREYYSSEIGYAEDLEEYNKKKELWKSAPKPKDFDLSVDLEDMNKQLRNIRRAVLNQKNYDQRTVKAVSDLVRKMLNIGWGDGLSRGKVGNLLSAAKNATGANDVKKYLDKAMGILAENYLNRLSTAYDNLINTKGARADQSGVIKMGSLDAKGQAFMSEYKKAINMDDKSLNNYIANIEEDSAKNEDNVEMNDYRLAGIQAAIMYKQQIGGNDADIAELKKQIGELKNKKDATKEDKDLLKSLEKKLFENKFDRITMYENLLNNIQRMVKESKGRAKEFREEITEHKNEILHRANLDLEGVDSTYYDTTTAKKKLVNNDLQRAVFSSTYTFEQFLKFFGKKAANGEGYLYNYFTKLNQDALDEEQLYNEMNRNALDEKTKELFGKEKFMKLVGIDGKGMKEMDVEVTDYSNKETGKRTIHLKQGQMLYIYLVNKETDGEMKLRAMGITEEDVAAIEENLDPRVKAMGEWLQDEYLPECQRRYQATHTKYFGAPMKDVENYFPLAINNRARNVKEDVNQDSDAMSQLAGTSTGAIVTRRVNVIPLDIENADAFEVAFNHLQEMEEWSAMLPFRQDINTMLSYTHFRNQVQNMSSVAYGSGKTLWDEFKQTAQIAAGTYKPKVNAGMMDSRIAAAMGGIAVAKISGRLWTAIKQSQSATVFLPESDFTRFVKNGVNPYGSWKWAKENIPDFRKRIENITYGDVKLRQYLDELEKYHDWTKVISKWGMAPNILVDGITCAVGARSVYETEVNRLTKLGYPKEKAEEKAYYKAVAAYNKTQQSSGGMYLSPMQVDRTYVSAALSLFKNANYAYGRMQIEACRGLARTYDFWGGKHKTTLIESMTRQIMEEDGLDENTARAIAKATYNRTFRQSIGRLINFATLVPVSWALYKVLPYLLTGDDDDKKKDMIEEAVLKGFATSLSDNYVIPFASNILNAGLKVEDGKPTFDPEVFRYQNLYINPATSDLANIYSMVGNQKWYSVANKLGMLGVQSLIGFNPETVGALYQALSEADYDNGNTAKEWQIGILKAISAPEESIRELYMDELGLKSGDIKKIPLAELEKRYAERQINRDNLLSQIGMDAETFNGYVDKYQKSFEKKIKDKMDKWDEYDKKKADEFFDTTSDHKLKDMIEKKRTKDANAAADEQIAKEGLNQEKKGKEPSEEAYDAVKMSIDVAEDNAISTYNKVLYKRYAALNDEYNNQTDAMKYIFMNKHPNFKAYKDLESEYTTYGKKMKELKEKLVSADGYDAKQTILKQIRAEREKFSELQSKVR